MIREEKTAWIAACIAYDMQRLEKLVGRDKAQKLIEKALGMAPAMIRMIDIDEELE